MNHNQNCVLSLCSVWSHSWGAVQVRAKSVSSSSSSSSSAARRGGDGTVEERELTGWGVYRDGDGEVEDCAAVADGWTARLGWARRRGQDLGLKLEELTHEAEVGGDDAAAPAHKLKGLVQTHALPLHQVGQANGGGAGDARLTVDQHSPTGVSYWIWEDDRGGEREVKGQMFPWTIYFISLYIY